MRIFGWIIGLGVLFIVGIGIITMVFGVAALPFHAGNAAINSAHGIIDKTLNADNVINNYEWFKQQCQDIKAQDSIIETSAYAMTSFEESAGPRTDWDWSDKAEYSRLSANLTGAKQYQASMIGDYNAKAKMLNRSIFNTEPCDMQVTR